MKQQAITLTHHESAGKTSVKVTRYIPQAERKPALRFSLRELIEALPLSTYTHTIWFGLLAWPITALGSYPVLQTAIKMGVISPEDRVLEQVLLLFGLLFSAVAVAALTFTKEGKVIRRDFQAKSLRKILEKPHLILTEEDGSFRICRLGELRKQEIEKSNTTLVPKETYQKIQALQP